MKSRLLIGVFLLSRISQIPTNASITGVVVELGTMRPVPGAIVAINSARAEADAAGRFTFNNVPPGHYRLFASHKNYVPANDSKLRRIGKSGEIDVRSGDQVSDIVLALIPNGSISGRLYNSNRDSVTNATVEALKYAYQDGRRILVTARTAPTNGDGEYVLSSLAPGKYVVRAVRPDGVLPVYYPNTTDASATSVLELPSGNNFTGVDITLGDSRPLRVRGHVTDGTSGNALGRIMLLLVPRRGTAATGTLQRAMASDTGSFEFRNMAPGSYDVVATGPDTPNGRLAGSSSIEVVNADVEDLTLIVQPQLTIKGRIRLEADQPAPANSSLQSLRVELRREPYTPELLIVLPGVTADGTFTFAGVTPGEYRITIGSGTLNACVKTANYGSIDALRPPFPINGPGEFIITLSSKCGSVEAVVEDDQQKPASRATVVLVPDPPYRHRFDLYFTAEAGSDARAHFHNVPPGDYKLFAWEDIPSDAWQDPEIMRGYDQRGQSVRITEGAAENLRLQLITD